MYKSLIFRVAGLLALFGVPVAVANGLSLHGSAVQGALLSGSAPPGSTVTFAGHRIRVGADGSFVIGIGRDAPPRAALTLTSRNGEESVRNIRIRQREYEVQRINGLPSRQVSPSKADMERIRRELAMIREVRRRDTASSDYLSGWQWPVEGTITGVYGSQRILNGKPRNPHSGVDIAAPRGTDVLAPADGIVTLTDPDMFFTGGTVMLDHGHGVTSVYVHLRNIVVKEGERLERGDKIGEVGATGRATGPNLHWGVSWFDVRLDPQLLVPPMPAPTDR
jgi:murein DD-endopeptidase MepM/ murein hydrolase activator NlpD